MFYELATENFIINILYNASYVYDLFQQNTELGAATERCSYAAGSRFRPETSRQSLHESTRY